MNRTLCYTLLDCRDGVIYISILGISGEIKVFGRLGAPSGLSPHLFTLLIERFEWLQHLPNLFNAGVDSGAEAYSV